MSKSGVGNCALGNFPGPDLIYAVIPATNGTLFATLNTAYIDPWIRARPACPSSSSAEIACDYRNSAGVTSITIPMIANTTYDVAADSWNNKSGSFTLTLSLQ